MRTHLWPLTALYLLSPALTHAQKFQVDAPAALHRTSHSTGVGSVDGFAPPVLGYVLDAAGSVHRIPGLPGASWLSGPARLGVQLASGAVSPRQDYVLGLAAADRRAVLLRFDGSPAQNVPGVDTGADRVVLSPGGTAAAFVFRERLQVVTGLPDAAAAAGVLDLSLLPGTPAAIAVSDDGSLILASAPAGDGSALFAISGRSAPRLLLNGGDFAAVAFLRGSNDAAVVDRLRNALYRVRASGEITPLAADGLAAPVAVAASSDGSRLFVVNSASASVGMIGAAGGPLALLSCSCSPTTLAPLAGAAVFRLTEISDDPLWLLDADAPEPRLLLVPQSSERRSDR